MSADAVGGLWTYALDLGAVLGQRGFDVTLAVLGPGLDDERRGDASGRGLELVETGRNPDWLAGSAQELVQTGKALAQTARRVKADLVHLNHPALLADTVFDAPVVAVCHSCLATWWSTVRAGPLPEDFGWRTALVERGLARADAIVAPSRAFAEATRRVYGFGEAPTVVLNGRAAAPLRSGAKRRTKPVQAVLTAGRLWDEGKNVAALDRVAGRVAVRCDAAGATLGPNGSSVALHNLRPLGTLGEAAMRERLDRRPIYASMALYEPFGLAVLEAAQAGCALLLSDIPTFRELWDGAAVFLPPHDDRLIASAVTRLIEDPTLRRDLARAASARAGDYTLAASADGMERVYRAASRAVRGDAAAA